MWDVKQLCLMLPQRARRRTFSSFSSSLLFCYFYYTHFSIVLSPVCTSPLTSCATVTLRPQIEGVIVLKKVVSFLYYFFSFLFSRLLLRWLFLLHYHMDASISTTVLESRFGELEGLWATACSRRVSSASGQSQTHRKAEDSQEGSQEPLFISSPVASDLLIQPAGSSKAPVSCKRVSEVRRPSRPSTGQSSSNRVNSFRVNINAVRNGTEAAEASGRRKSRPLPKSVGASPTPSKSQPRTAAANAAADKKPYVTPPRSMRRAASPSSASATPVRRSAAASVTSHPATASSSPQPTRRPATKPTAAPSSLRNGSTAAPSPSPSVAPARSRSRSPSRAESPRAPSLPAKSRPTGATTTTCSTSSAAGPRPTRHRPGPAADGNPPAASSGPIPAPPALDSGCSPREGGIKLPSIASPVAHSSGPHCRFWQTFARSVASSCEHHPLSTEFITCYPLPPTQPTKVRTEDPFFSFFLDLSPFKRMKMKQNRLFSELLYLLGFEMHEQERTSDRKPKEWHWLPAPSGESGSFFSVSSIYYDEAG
eukprot:gene8228-5750_t